jgi:hypothetical protein
MKIAKKEFKQCARQLVADPTIQKMETENFIFIKVDGNITVKFKHIDGLTGYFTMEEIKSPKILTVILKTVEKEMEKKLKEVSYETEKN